MTLAEARKIVRAKWPQAFGWREFTVSDYTVVAYPGGHVLSRAWSATHAWVLAAENATIDSGKATK